MLPLSRIVCPLDFSEPSQKALQTAIEFAGQFRAELILVHVIAPAAPGIPADPTYAFAGTEDYEKALRTQAEEQLTLAEQRLPEESFVCAWTTLSRGQPTTTRSARWKPMGRTMERKALLSNSLRPVNRSERTGNPTRIAAPGLTGCPSRGQVGRSMVTKNIEGTTMT